MKLSLAIPKEKALKAAIVECKQLQANTKLYPTEANVRVLEYKVAAAEALKQSIANDAEIKEALKDINPTPSEDGIDLSMYSRGKGFMNSGMDLQKAYLSKDWDISTKPVVSLGRLFRTESPNGRR